MRSLLFHAKVQINAWNEEKAAPVFLFFPDSAPSRRAALLTARLYQDPSHSGRTNAVFGTPKSDLGKTNAVFGQPSRRFLHTRFNKVA